MRWRPFTALRPGADRRVRADPPRSSTRRAAAAARSRPTWPAIVLRTPKGWTGPARGRRGPGRGHLPLPPGAPAPASVSDPEHLAMLEAWLRSYRPEDHFDSRTARSSTSWPRWLRRPRSAWVRIAHANGGRLRKPLALRDLANYELAVDRPGVTSHETTRPLGEMVRDLLADNRGRFRLFCPDETNSNRLGAVFEVEDRCLMDARPDDDHVSTEGRVMEVLSEHLCQGWLEGYSLTGRHGLFATYEAFAMVSASMAIQHAKWLEAAEELRVAPPGAVAEHAPDLDLLAQRPQRLQPSGPRPDRHDDLAARKRRPRLPATRRQHPALGRRALLRLHRLRQPDRRRQAGSSAVPRSRRSAPPCGSRRFDLGLGEHGRGRAARRHPRRDRRCADARGPGGRGALARAASPSCECASSTSST